MPELCELSITVTTPPPKSPNVYGAPAGSKSVAEKAESSPPSPPVPPEPIGVTISSNKKVQLSGSPPASPLTPRSKISVTWVTPGPVFPVKSKLSSSHPEPVWVTERSTLRPSSLKRTGTARWAKTFIVNTLLLEKSTSPGNVSVLPPNTSPANFCI